MAKTPVKAVELKVALAGTDTSQKPLSQALDGSGKIVFEFSAQQAERIQEVMRLGFDRQTGQAFSLRMLVERGKQSVQKEPKEKEQEE